MEVIFQNGLDEGFHVLADIENDVILRWSMFNNETLEYQDDGSTTIDFEEPFVFKYINVSINSIASLIHLFYPLSSGFNVMRMAGH